MALTMFQKQESFLKPLVDQFAKEGKDKKVVFEAIFTKTNAKPKWYFRKDVSTNYKLRYKYIHFHEQVMKKTFFFSGIIPRL